MSPHDDTRNTRLFRASGPFGPRRILPLNQSTIRRFDSELWSLPVTLPVCLTRYRTCYAAFAFGLTLTGRSSTDKQG